MSFDVLKGIDDIAGMYALIQDAKAANSAYANNIDLLEWNDFQKAKVEERQQAFQLLKENVKNTYAGINKDTAKSLDELYMINVTNEDARNYVKKYLKTSGFEEFLDDKGAELQHNLEFNVEQAKNTTDQFNNYNESIRGGEHVLDALNKMKNEAESLASHAAVFRQMYNNDVNAYIKAHPDIFTDADKYIDPTLPRPKDKAELAIWTAAQKENWLARALRTPKKIGGKGQQYGFSTSQADLYKQAGKSHQFSVLKLANSLKASEDVTTGLANDDAYWKKIGGKTEDLFAGGNKQFNIIEEQENRFTKTELFPKIIAALDYGKVDEVNPKVATWMSEYEKAAGPNKLSIQENAISKIEELLVPHNEGFITGAFGYGFKAGSNMEKSDFAPKDWGYTETFGGGEKAKARSSHLLNMLKTVRGIDDMYPHWKTRYEYDFNVFDIGK